MAIAVGSQPSFAQCHASGSAPGDGCVVFCITPSGSSSGVIFGAGLDGAGATAWANMPCSAPESKSRLASTQAPDGSVLLAFGHGAGAAMDILAQNVRPDGGLGVPQCYANCDGSTTPPVLNVADFGCFLGKFAAGDAYANCDGSTTPPVLNVADFGCFLGKFAAGCR